MPIRPEMKALYPANWKQISERIRFKRAKNKCEKCGAPNGQTVFRSEDGTTYMLECGATHCSETGNLLGYTRGSEMPKGRFVKIVLTVAHLNHDPADCADENLAAWCQRCHLRYDHEMHKANSAQTRHSKKAVADLFADSQTARPSV